MEKYSEKTRAERLRERGTDKLLEKVNEKKQPSFSYTDLGNAERLIYEHGENFRYHTERKKWLYWNGKYWGLDNTNQLKRKAIEVVRGMQNQIEHIQNADERELFLKHIVRSQSASRIQAMLNLADSVSSDIPINESKLDQNEYLLNVANGTIDLKTLEMYGVSYSILNDHDRNQLLTKYIDIPFNPEAKCPTWEKFLNSIFMRNKDVIFYIQRIIGYALTGSNKEEAMFIFHGQKGRNGKSTFIKAIHRLLGSYAGATNPSTFMKKGNTARHTLAEFVGLRFLSTSEVERGEELAVQLMKQITGRDLVEAERKYENPFTYLPNYKIFMLTNNKPNIYERRKAIWERIHLIEFNNYIEKQNRDKNLDKKLEAEMEGILRWALEGCREWQRQGLNPPAEILDAVKRYEEEQDIIGQFIRENYEVDLRNEEYWEAPERIYLNYKTWCNENGFGCLNNNNFGVEMKERFTFKTKRVEWNRKIQPKKVYVGIRLK
nr:phage/plasmid primase, P4 family [Neobacillus sp. Marseille-Q6967]